MRGIQYAAAFRFHHQCLWNTRPVKPGDDIESKRTFAIPRRDAPEVCWNFSPRKTEGVGNAGCPLHPQPVCIGSEHTVVTAGRRNTLHSRTQWF
jgi:hypothetical protein